MSSQSITFDPTLPTPTYRPRPTLQRSSRVIRRNAASVSTTALISAPVAILQNTATVSERQSTRSRTRQRRHRSSLHLAVPPIQDRESSLYSPVSIVHTNITQWSKSCSDLLLPSQFPKEERPSTIGTGITGTGTNSTTTNCLGLDQRLSLSTPTATAPSGGDNCTDSIVRWCESTLEHSIITDNAHYDLGLDTKTKAVTAIDRLDFVYPQSFTDYSHLLIDDGCYTNGSGPIAHPHTQNKGKEIKWRDLKKKLKGVKAFTMSPSTTPTPGTPTPAVPPRSALRGSPRHRTSTSTTRPIVAERDSSLYVLEVGAPLEQTPSLSSASASESESEHTDVPTRISANMARRSTMPEPEKERDYGVFGKKRIGSVSDRDPLRVRDGLGPKESPSGVYTRACGPRPSHFPTHVYTPPNFQLYPTPSSSAPSRSASSSSSEDLPQTPISPSLRVFGNKTMAGLRRLSGIPASLASLDPRASPSPTTASSARDSYFSYSTASSRQTSWGPVTPNSVNFPAGLGVGLTEKEGLTAALPSSLTELVPAPMAKRPVDEPKIKRKPVPEVLDLDAELSGPKRGSVTHAL